MIQVKALNKRRDDNYIYIDHLPDHCPICHKGIEAVHLNTYLSEGDIRSYLTVIVCRCPCQPCDKIFMAEYKFHSVTREGSKLYTYSASYPLTYETSIIEKEIEHISPSFKTIYSQSEQAESLGLKEICGAGYRKALEFLVKDFVLHMAKDNTKIEPDAIPKTDLSACIHNYIDDHKIKQLAKRATWLGNDETHYYRKWGDKDLNDLKTLIRLTRNAIHSEILSQEYMKDMDEKKN